MKYTKTPLSIHQQVQRLEDRGLIIDDMDSAMNYLSKISYYRLRAYTYPFQDNENPEADHRFIRDDIHLSEIMRLYYFDKKLRNLIFKVLEEVEVALRARIIQVYSEHYGDSHWFLNKSVYKDTEIYKDEKADISQYGVLVFDIRNEIIRSSEDFIKHYKDKYGDPELPPAWMALEVLTIGTLSRLYKQLINSELKEKIAYDFGLPNSNILSNWIRAFAFLRNCCAHHSRVWNRRFIINVILPYNTLYPFIDKATSRSVF